MPVAKGQTIIKWDQDMIDALYKARAEGKSWEHTAQIIGVTADTVRRYARKLGMYMGHISIGMISGERVLQGYVPTYDTSHRRKQSPRWNQEK